MGVYGYTWITDNGTTIVTDDPTTITECFHYLPASGYGALGSAGIAEIEINPSCAVTTDTTAANYSGFTAEWDYIDPDQLNTSPQIQYTGYIRNDVDAGEKWAHARGAISGVGQQNFKVIFGAGATYYVFNSSVELRGEYTSAVTGTTIDTVDDLNGRLFAALGDAFILAKYNSDDKEWVISWKTWNTTTSQWDTGGETNGSPTLSKDITLKTRHQNGDVFPLQVFVGKEQLPSANPNWQVGQNSESMEGTAMPNAQTGFEEHRDDKWTFRITNEINHSIFGVDYFE